MKGLPRWFLNRILSVKTPFGNPRNKPLSLWTQNPKIFWFSLTLRPTAFWLQEGEKNHKSYPLEHPKPGSTKSSSHTKIFLRFGRILGSVKRGLWTVFVADFWQHNTTFLALFCAEFSAPIYRHKALKFLFHFFAQKCANLHFSP